MLRQHIGLVIGSKNISSRVSGDVRQECRWGSGKARLRTFSYGLLWWVVPLVFDAAALDYEVVEPRNAGHVRRSVRDLIWTGKDEFRARPPSYQHDPSPHAALGNPLDRSKYEAGEGLVAVGPNAWREILRGLNEGCMAERPPQAPPKPVDLDSEAKSTDEKPKEEQAEPLLDLSPGNIPSFALPGLGYITGKNQAGWSGFPKRIYGWFTERKTAKEIGEESLKVCFGRARDFKADDANLGAKDLYIDDDWSDELKGAVEEVHVPEEVAEKLYIYA